jgi:hypothetical protein
VGTIGPYWSEQSACAAWVALQTGCQVLQGWPQSQQHYHKSEQNHPIELKAPVIPVLSPPSSIDHTCLSMGCFLYKSGEEFSQQSNGDTVCHMVVLLGFCDMSQPLGEYPHW